MSNFNWSGAQNNFRLPGAQEQGQAISDMSFPQYQAQGQSQGWLGNLIGGLQSNPEGFAQIAGRMGAAILGPDHPLGAMGAGAAEWGRSSRVNKVLQQAQQKRKSRKDQLLAYLADSLGDLDIPTGEGLDGPDSLDLSIGSDGSFTTRRKGKLVQPPKALTDAYDPR